MWHFSGHSLNACPLFTYQQMGAMLQYVGHNVSENGAGLLFDYADIEG